MQINYKWLIVLILAITLVLAGCMPISSISSFPTIKSSFISPYISQPYIPGILTPDGEHLMLSDFTQVELGTGITSRPFDEFLPDDWRNTYYVDNMIWSPDGNYLVVSTHKGGATLPPSRDIVFIIGAQTQSISEPLNIGPILYGSPFGERILANPLKIMPPFWQVYDLNAREIVSIPPKIKNLENQETGGMKQFLWSREANVPIAKIDWRDPINAGGATEPQEIGISLAFGGKSGELNHDSSSYAKKFTSTPPDNVVYAIFDPKGQYILIVQWKCSGNDVQQCSLYPGKEYFDNITDTVLILVDWRTGEQQELIRLSQIDPLNVVSRYADWSMDGNTIIVWRQDASPVVLKIKYP